MMKLGGRCSVQKSPLSSNLGVIAPWVHTPKNVALGYDVGKISAGCLVISCYTNYDVIFGRIFAVNPFTADPIKALHFAILV